ncbi:MAG: AI-2E family transporter [Negativibacillus sp.]
MELDKQTIKKIIGLISFAILLSWGLKNTEFIKRLIALALGLLQPFLIGGVIAFVVNVPMRALENACFIKPYQKRLAAQAAAKPAGKGSTVPAKPPIWYRAKRPLSLILSLLLVLGVIGVGTLIVVPETVSSFSSIVNNLRNFPLMLNQWAQELMDWMPQAAVWLEELNLNLDLTSIDWREIITQVVNFLQNGAGNVLNTTFTVASGIFNGIVTGFLAIVFSFYLLMNKEKLGSQTKQLLYALLKEPHADYLVRVGQMTNRTFSKFLSGQCVEAVILATLFFVSMSILRFPYAMIISTLIAFTALIPIFGAFIGCVVGAFLILLVDPVRAFWFVVLFLFLQQFEGNIIYPRVVGSSVGLPSMWVLVAVTLGGSMMGVLGMLVYIPMFSVFYRLIREAVSDRLKAKQVPAEKFRS